MKHQTLKDIKALTAATLATFTLASCGDDSPIVKEDIKSTVLVYAVASNNLYSNLIEDKEEMIMAASQMNMEGLRLLVYQVTPYDDAALLELKPMGDGSYDFETVKEYDKNVYSTDPKRISEVINDVKTGYNSNLYGLVLWSHGTGLDPFNSTRSAEDGSHPMLHSFGSDKNPNIDSKYSDQINIDELADAIPDNLFNFIWFDACYMSGIETIYELRDKCKYFVGYPTEVYTPGMPYNLTLPYFLAESPNLVKGAESFFNYYANYSSSSMRVATVCVVDMHKLEAVADYCKMAYADTPAPVTSGLLKYTRGSIGPFYDFGQYTKVMSSNNKANPDVTVFEEALQDMILYSAATDKDFNYNSIDPEKFCGISCHVFTDDGSSKANFYKTLDWYNRVYK